MESPTASRSRWRALQPGPPSKDTPASRNYPLGPHASPPAPPPDLHRFPWRFHHQRRHPLDTPGRPGFARSHFPLVARSIRDDDAADSSYGRLRLAEDSLRLIGPTRAPGLPRCDRSRRDIGLVALTEPLIHVVVDLDGALGHCQHAVISPWPDSHIHGVNSDRQLAAVANEDRYHPRACLLARLLFDLLDGANTCADLAHLSSQPILAQGPQLDEGERKGQAGENRVDSCYGHPPDHGITVAELVRLGPDPPQRRLTGLRDH